MITPINNHIIIEPQAEQSSFQSSQQSYEERGKVIALDTSVSREQTICNYPFEVGSFVFFDSWCAAKYKDKDGKEFWVVPFDKIRAVENDT